MTQQLATPRFDPQRYRNTFFRSFRTEMRKLALRSLFVTAAIGLLLHSGLILLVTSVVDEGNVGATFVTPGWTLITLFVISISTLAVTSEYSSNTIRTSVLADPSRLRFYSAKLLAVAVIAFVFIAATFGIALLEATLRVDGFAPLNDGAWPIFAYVALSVLIAVITAAFGFILRSTAGTIVLMVVLIYMLDLLALIPLDFFRDVVTQLTPTSLINLALAPADAPIPPDSLVSSPTMAAAIMLLYAVIIAIAGAFSFTKRDV